MQHTPCSCTLEELPELTKGVNFRTKKFFDKGLGEEHSPYIQMFLHSLAEEFNTDGTCPMERVLMPLSFDAEAEICATCRQSVTQAFAYSDVKTSRTRQELVNVLRELCILAGKVSDKASSIPEVSPVKPAVTTSPVKPVTIIRGIQNPYHQGTITHYDPLVDRVSGNPTHPSLVSQSVPPPLSPTNPRLLAELREAMNTKPVSHSWGKHINIAA